MEQLIDLQEKQYIVAGVGGIGAAVAELIDSLGAKLILIDIDDEKTKALISSLKGEGNRHFHCDFSSVDSVESVVKDIIAECGPVDGLVYCTGIGDSRPLKLSKYDYMKKMMDINFFSYIELVRTLTVKGRYIEGMSIVGISSVGAILGNPGQTAYCASKAAMNGATRSMAKELADKHIRINTIAPGTTDTAMFRKAESSLSDSSAFQSRLERQYLGLCQPQDIANMVVFLLSDMSRMITGSCIGVDGGKLSS